VAKFSEHINQAKSNLNFLKSILNSKEYWDWKVTVSFYIAVHLINAHLANKANLHYRSHDKVDKALNPYSPISVTKLSENNYLAYTKLQGLSRRSRYLVHDKPGNKSEDNHFTHEKHFIRAIKNLDKVLKFISNEYKVSFDILDIKSEYYKSKSLEYFCPVG
jgi:hypothetical protein